LQKKPIILNRDCSQGRVQWMSEDFLFLCQFVTILYLSNTKFVCVSVSLYMHKDLSTALLCLQSRDPFTYSESTASSRISKSIA